MVVPIRMTWRDLLFAHWPVSPASLDACVPDAFELDTFDGQAWVSVIPFVNEAIRPVGVPRRFGMHLPELNVRTYVHHRGEPAIYFFSLDADGWLGVVGARLFHHLPYYQARITTERDEDRVSFASRRRHPGARHGAFVASYGPTGAPFPAADRSLPAFLLERYRFVTEGRGGEIRETVVDHEPWIVRPAAVDIAIDTIRAADALPVSDATPICQFAHGVDVRASASRPA